MKLFELIKLVELFRLFELFIILKFLGYLGRCEGTAFCHLYAIPEGKFILISNILVSSSDVPKRVKTVEKFL